MTTLDTRGNVCPMPLIMLKKALLEPENQHGLIVLTDNEISYTNLKSYLSNNQFIFETEVLDNYWSIKIVESKQPSKTIIKPNETVVVVNKNKMGHGNDDLGEILIKGFFNALNNLENKPNKIIFYNSGVLLCKDSYIENKVLKELSEKGIDLVLCGACVDFYQIKDNLNIGRISNMLEICEILMKCEKIFYV